MNGSLLGPSGLKKKTRHKDVMSDESLSDDKRAVSVAAAAYAGTIDCHRNTGPRHDEGKSDTNRYKLQATFKGVHALHVAIDFDVRGVLAAPEITRKPLA